MPAGFNDNSAIVQALPIGISRDPAWLRLMTRLEKTNEEGRVAIAALKLVREQIATLIAQKDFNEHMAAAHTG